MSLYLDCLMATYNRKPIGFVKPVWDTWEMKQMVLTEKTSTVQVD